MARGRKEGKPLPAAGDASGELAAVRQLDRELLQAGRARKKTTGAKKAAKSGGAARKSSSSRARR
jgi:hypothetical protein